MTIENQVIERMPLALAASVRASLMTCICISKRREFSIMPTIAAVGLALLASSAPDTTYSAGSAGNAAGG